MATTEIEKLERRYAENPQGLTFAPLAEVHRKNGDVARALELLKAGLELHPNYIPASIVLGRCHWDLGDFPAAESAFAHVLRLDDENVIALKSLADINEKLERFTEAQRWLNRLISIDRSNEEARQQLARLEAARQTRPATPMSQETSAAEAEPAKSEAPVSSPQPKQEEPPAPAPLSLTAELESAGAVKSESSALEFIDTSASAAPSEKLPHAPLLAEPINPPAEEPAAVEGLISQEFVPPADSYRSHPELTKEFVEPAASNELDLEGLEVETAEEVELQSSGGSEFRVPNAAEDFMEAAFAAPPSRSPDLSAVPPEAPELPPPPPAAPTPSPDLELNIPAPSPPAQRPYSVRETKGQSVAAFFVALLGARPAGAPNARPTGTHQGESPGQVAPQPAAPAERPSPSASGASGDAAVSFDDLFGMPAEPSPTPKGTTDPGKEDLDQFQTWLQNLKR
jgi:tetratricopeptide (TPR) repeat protein